MNALPRTFGHDSLIVSLALVFAFVSAPVYAQQRGGRGGAAERKPAAQKREAQRTRRAQEEAVSILADTADKARLFDDLSYRARIQTLAADALWRTDESRARDIFRRAWDAATAADKAYQEELERESGAPPDSAGLVVTDSRDEVLQVVAAHDPQLAGVFLREISNESGADKSASEDKSDLRRSPWRELSPTGARRLALAYDLLSEGQFARAAEIAAPVINEGVSGDLMTFILRLHSHREGSNYSDALYLRLIQRTAADAKADVNALLLLSSRIVSPHLLTVVDETGAVQFRSLPYWTASSHQTQADYNVSKSFYNLAVSMLLRPNARRDGVNSVQETTSRYFAIGRLLPFFKGGAAEYARYAPELRAHHDALAAEIEAGRRDSLSTRFDLQSLTPKRTIDPLGIQVENLARAGGAAERDRIAFQIVRAAARNRLWDRARRTADGIDDLNARRTAFSFIAASQIADIPRAYADDREEDFEGVVKFVDGADVPPLAKAWGMAHAAHIAARKGDKERAAELVNEAERHAARVDGGSRQRVAAYGVVAAAAAQIDRRRAWELLAELVRAANAVDDYAGDEVSLDLADDGGATEGAADTFSFQAEAFRLDKIFATMARLDFDKALAEARALEGKVPRAFASIAIARAVLERKP